MAPDDLVAGKTYGAAIVEAIHDCGALILLVSADAIRSAHVLREVERATSLAKPVIPVRLDESPLSPDLEYFLSATHWMTWPADTGDPCEILAVLRQVMPMDAPPRPVPAASSQPPRGLAFRVVRGKALSMDHLCQAVEIDAHWYPEAFRGTLETCLPWFERNPLIYTMLVDSRSDQVIGYFNAMPVTDAYFEELKTGAHSDMETTPDDICTYDFPDTYKLYFSSIALHPDFAEPAATKALFDAFMAHIVELAENDFWFSEMLVDAVTPAGEQLARRFGMTRLHPTSHDSSIYTLTMLPPTNLRATTDLARRVRDIYAQRSRDLGTSD